MIRVPTHRIPTHPGEMLVEEFLNPMNITCQELSAAIHMPSQYIEDVVEARTELTPSTALRLSRYFGNSVDFWISLQVRWDLYHAQKRESATLELIQPRQLA